MDGGLVVVGMVALWVMVIGDGGWFCVGGGWEVVWWWVVFDVGWVVGLVMGGLSLVGWVVVWLWVGGGLCLVLGGWVLWWWLGAFVLVVGLVEGCDWCLVGDVGWMVCGGR